MGLQENIPKKNELERHYIQILMPDKSSEWIQKREYTLMKQYRKQAMRPYFLFQFAVYCLQNICFIVMIPGSDPLHKIMFMALILLNAVAGCACALFVAGRSWKTVSQVSRNIRFAVIVTAIFMNAILIPYGFISGWAIEDLNSCLCSFLLTEIQAVFLLWTLLVIRRG